MKLARQPHIEVDDKEQEMTKRSMDVAPDDPESGASRAPDTAALPDPGNRSSPAPVPDLSLPAHWLGFGQRLLAELHQLREDDFLIVLAKESNRFVQFAAQGAHGLRVEATSNHFLQGTERLDEEQMRTMIRLGWRAPTGSASDATPENDPAGSANYFLDLRPPIGYEATVERTVATLAQVFGVPHEGYLAYQSFDFSGNDRALPRLQLKRQLRDPELRLAELADRLLAILRETTGIPELDFDEDGDIGVGLDPGRALFVRLVGQPPQVRFHAPLLRDAKPSKRLLEHLNQLNLHGGPLRYLLLHRTTVIAVLDVPAWPLLARHVVDSLERFAAAAQGSSAWLQAASEGRTSGARPTATKSLH